MALILLYHRVSDNDVDPWSLVVSPARFAEQMEALRAEFQLVSLTELTQAHAAGKCPDDAVAVSFDDGYRDNLANAVPILERAGVPASIFVCAAAVGREQEFWWDQLQQVLLESDTPLPERLELDIAGKRVSWALSPKHRDPSAQNWWFGSRSLRHAVPQSLYTEIYEQIRPLPADAQALAMEQILAWSSTSAAARPAYRTVGVDELRYLANRSMIDIGSHTLHHPLLPAHNAEYQRHEIVAGRRILEQMIDRQVQHFAYPYGEYDQRSLNILHEERFRSGSTCHETAATQDNNLYELPRLKIKDWSPDLFIETLRSKASAARYSYCTLDIGDEISFPIYVFQSHTGDMYEGAITCVPHRHEPGHCLFGPGTKIMRSGLYRTSFALVQDDSGARRNVVLDIYENRARNAVLAEAELDVDTSFQSSMPIPYLDFSATAGDTVEFRVFWRGGGRLKLSGVALRRLA